MVQSFLRIFQFVGIVESVAIEGVDLKQVEELNKFPNASPSTLTASNKILWRRMVQEILQDKVNYKHSFKLNITLRQIQSKSAIQMHSSVSSIVIPCGESSRRIRERESPGILAGLSLSLIESGIQFISLHVQTEKKKMVALLVCA